MKNSSPRCPSARTEYSIWRVPYFAVPLCGMSIFHTMSFRFESTHGESTISFWYQFEEFREQTCDTNQGEGGGGKGSIGKAGILYTVLHSDLEFISIFYLQKCAVDTEIVFLLKWYTALKKRSISDRVRDKPLMFLISSIFGNYSSEYISGTKSKLNMST